MLEGSTIVPPSGFDQCLQDIKVAGSDMNQERIAAHTHMLTIVPRRRAIVGLAAAIGLGDLITGAAKKRKKKKKKCKTCDPCQQCVKGKCKPTAAGTPCGTGHQCFANGGCKACDVCLGDCASTYLQDAASAATNGATIRICPGRYPTNAVINKSLTFIGAGSGSGGTILDGGDRGRVLDVASAVLEVRGLAIAGGKAAQGAGIQAYFSEVRLEDVSLSGHHSSGAGGAIHNDRSKVTLINTRITGCSAERGGGIHNGLNGELTLRSNSVITGNSATGSGGGADDPVAGGIQHVGLSVQVLDGSSVTGNTPVNCVGTTVC